MSGIELFPYQSQVFDGHEFLFQPHGIERVESDGTRTTILPIDSVSEDRIASYTTSLTPLGVLDGELFFLKRLSRQVFHSDQPRQYEYELWNTNGTATGTSRIQQFIPFDSNFNELIQITNHRSGGDVILFNVESSPTSLPRIETWGISSKSRTATRLLFSSGIDTVVTDSPPTFQGIDGALWVTDGTLEGTNRILDNNGIPATVGQLKQSVFDKESRMGYLIFTTQDGYDIWKSHLNDSSLSQVTSAGSGFKFRHNATSVSAVIANESLYFALAGADETELWYSDGTADGTRLLTTLETPPGVAIPDERIELIAFGDDALFTAFDAEHGTELWRADSDDSFRRELLMDIQPGTNSSAPAEFARFGDQVYFIADDGANGSELWVTDGSADGTRLFVDLALGPASSNPHNLSVANGRLFFTALDDTGYEAWASDGTILGTHSGG